MPDAPNHPNDRYIRLIEAMLAKPPTPAFVPEVENESTIQVERGLILPMAMAGAEPHEIERIMERLLRPGSSKARVVDAAGQSRPPYSGLLVHACRRAMRLKEIDDSALQEWAARLREPTATPVERAWSSLATGESQLWPFVAQQQPNGALLPDDPSENPETHWYQELTLLHAVATHGYIQRDSEALAVADRAAMYHLNETQPDHATNEPWGLLAFIHNPETHLLVDQLLHTVQVQQPAGPRGVTRILLADTLLCLRNPPAFTAR